jgi:aryl-alcohol dehydrogenase-like predicted oxidoreductase
MGMSDFYGVADEAESLRTIHRALDAGINLLDTGDFYGMGHNEMLLRQVLKERRDEALVCVKFGALAELAIAWALTRGPELVPLIGARKVVRLEEALRATSVQLSASDLTEIDQAAPPGSVAGDRYGAEQMAVLDSER